MNIQNITNLIDENISLITIDAKALSEARERAAKFLVVQSILASFIKQFDDDKAKLITLSEANYARAISVAEGKNITEKKVSVNLDTSYTNSREALEQLESVRNYIKTHIKIFENAHLTFRQYSRE